MLHWMASFQSSQYRVGVNGRTPEDLVTKSVREGVQDGGASASDRWLADTSSADRGLRIRDIQCGPLHVHRDIQDGRRLIVVEPLGDHHAVMWIENPFLADCMANAESRPA